MVEIPMKISPTGWCGSKASRMIRRQDGDERLDSMHAAAQERDGDLTLQVRIWRLGDGCAVCSRLLAATFSLPASATATT
jgi:hypothetical protein